MPIGPGTALVAIGAGIAVGFSAIGAGIGVGITGAASAGVTAEKPEKFGMALIFTAIPQTQAIYGLLVAVLILLSGGFLGGTAGDIPIPIGLSAVGAGLAVGLAGLSSIGQGIASSAGVATAAERPETFGKGVVFSVICETQAIYGLLVAVLILVFSGLLSGNYIATTAAGLAGIGCGLSIGLSGTSAIGQGIAASAGVAATSEKPELFGKGVVFAAICETQAIYGLLAAILIMSFTGMFTGNLVATLAAGVVCIGAGLATGFAGFSAIGQGIAAAAGIGATAEKPEMFGKGIVFAAICETQAIYGLLVAVLLMAFTGLISGDMTLTLAVGFAAIAGGLAVGLAGLSAIGQGIAASAGIAATGEKPEMFGKGVVFSAICETQAIYGLLVAILIMVFTGMITHDFITTLGVGIATIGAGIAVGLGGFSAIGQGITCASGIAATARRSEAMGRSLVFAAMSETFAIFGLLVAILILFGLGIFTM
ncbi:V/A-type H+-transporting ATPase subunit K [Methanolinea mesophila]|uniref:V-type ATP synthase subunit K n=1 Tax=Methanolinea mesophila TaxID=547055 RepID=UPI001AE795B7|nr:V-type ATP synthase subunit K [Methanolinea mesophila]MBP1927534.1 V/A-type H+-transporting ATPase subunit K [Methanolinea mesophila]